MSMLAERKVKQKWSLNPRGKLWSEDSNKFGQKMLEKMGWSPGKGLGAREDGIVEHVKVSYKNDTQGMGFKDRNDQWTEHDAGFNQLLENLSKDINNGANDGKKKKKTEFASLQKKSESSRVRVHYQKYTRGKDLSRCSEKDLANIFGRKSFVEETDLALDNPNFDNSVIETDEEGDNNKFEVVREKSDLVFDNPNFDNYYGERTEQGFDNNEFEIVREKKRDKLKGKKKEKKRKGDDDSNECYEVIRKKRKDCEDLAIVNPSFSKNEEEPTNCLPGNQFEVVRKNKKTKRKSKLAAIENPTFNESLEQPKLEEKIAKKRNGDLAIDNPNFSNNEEAPTNSLVQNEFEVVRKEKKVKKRSKLTAIENPTFNDQLEEPETKKKRKKEKKPEITDKRTLSPIEEEEIECDIMLNVSSVEQKSERNELFKINDKVVSVVENKVRSLSKKIDNVEAELENDMNNAKLLKFIGEIGGPDGDNELLEEGTRLRFKYAKLTRRVQPWLKNASDAKKSYKHLIRGDIIVQFPNTNLHQIEGYATRIYRK